MSELTSKLEVFFDGGCAVCARQARALGEGDGQLRLIDITAPGFDPTHLGKTQEELMGQLHVRDATEGRWHRGVDALREIYGRLGRRGLVGLSRLPGIAGALDAGYRLFARNRRRWFGRGARETTRSSHQR